MTTNTELEEGDLIFIAEIMVITHLKMNLVTPSLTVTLICSNGIAEMQKEALRNLLRLSLQDPRFRKKFNDYFSTHPLDDVRTDGQEWLREILVWET